MLTASELTKSFGGRVLFEKASLQVNRGDRIALVGPNGAGKSTLFSLILGEASPDEGRVSLQRGATLGYLPQETADVGDETVLDLATAISPEFVKVREIIHRHEAGESVDDEAYHEALATFDELGGWQLEPKAKRILNGLAFRETDFERPASALSGGWIMRAHLARLLVQEPDLLMLDEPTNHLDLSSLIWFQEYLMNYSGAILMISHDREFLNKLADQTLEIRAKALHSYRGNYDSYIEQRAAREAQHLAAYKNQQKEIDQLQRFADRFRAKASKASQAQSKLKQIDRMEKIEAPVQAGRGIHFKFPQPPRGGQRTIALEQIRMAYGENVVYENLNLEIERGQRTALVGPNGAGKSTLLKILAGELEFQAGQRIVGHNVTAGYFAQHRVEMLASKATVLEEVMRLPVPVPEQSARSILGSFLFSGEDVFKPISVLSGGEKSRLALVRLLLNPPNFLLMDEPTTHLDMDSIDALIGALRQFEGSLVFISHDVYFIRQMASSILHVDSGTTNFYPGDYQYFLDKTQVTNVQEGIAGVGNAQPEMAAKKADDRPVGASASPRKSKEQKRAEAQERQAKSEAKRAVRERLTKVESEIHRLEALQQKLTAELEDSATYDNPSNAIKLNREIAGIADSLERLAPEWEQAAEAVAAMDEATA